MNRLLARRDLLKTLVNEGAVPRPFAEKMLAADRGGDTSPRLEIQGGDDESEIRLYDYIDSWGGIWGISAQDVIDALDEVTSPKIKLRINSPGGEVFEGVAIYNLFADHPADVHVVIDSMAASIASVIAMAGDRITMNRGAEMMIHNAWGFAMGDYNDMRAYADILERQSTKAAKIYEARAGGDVDQWKSAMDAETWYDAEEAIAAGLADDMIDLKSKDDGGSDPSNLMTWDLSLFRHQGRSDAPGPTVPTEPTSEDAPDADDPTAATAAEQVEARQRAEQVVARAKLRLAELSLT